MSSLDQSSAYVKKDAGVFFDDGREIDLLHFVYGHPRLDEVRGSPSGVCSLLDEYARTKKYLMNVGHLKGGIVTDLIKQVKPKVMVELGGYVGYSCILYADAVRQAGGQRFFSLERNPEFAALIGSLVDLAGLSSFVTVVVGPSSGSLRRLHSSGQLARIDLLFLDHFKPAYVPDLKLCEALGLIGEGTVLAADNVIHPGNPPYLEYVRASVAQKLRMATEKADVKGQFKAEQVQQYKKRVDEEVLETEAGDPRIVYESRLVESFEPTGEKDGVEITTCVGHE